MGTVVSLSGGKDSTAMLLMLLEKGEQVDEAMVYDTGMEFPEMYEHLDKLETYTGVKFTRIKMEPSFEYWMLDHELTRGKRKGSHGYGWAKPNARWCTAKKTSAMDKHVKSLGGVDGYCIGIASDENRPLVAGKRYPLVEWGVTEADALAYCYRHGFYWGGLYERKKRVSCWCCPLQSLNDLRVLRELHPELWAKLLEMDARACNDFRNDYTAEQLERRFSNEEKQTRLEV
jgi:3'-phosphoadenosine 5'-phosphosulfate sulfotransferase (PAPS reductase)/FAD synthetase